MDWCGQLLAATRAESAASAIVLAVLSACLLLILYRPRRTELEGTPHDVPVSAIVVAMGWILLALGVQYLTQNSTPARTLSVLALWAVCFEESIQTLIPAAAYLLPRSVKRAAEINRINEEAFRQQTEAATGPAPPLMGAPASRRWLPAEWPHHLAVGITVGLAALVPTALISQLFAGARDSEASHILLRTIRDNGWEYILPIAITAVLLAPLKEELLFRVILQGWFADRVGKPAILLSSLVFASVHGTADAALLVPLSLILGCLYEYRRSYLEVVAAHAAFNAVNLFAAANGLG